MIRHTKQKIDTAQCRLQVAKLCLESGAKNAVEVGVWAGRLTEKLLEVPTLEKIFLVDPWISYRSYPRPQEVMDHLYGDVVKKFGRNTRVEIIRKASPGAADFFEDCSVDFIHIDGDHEEVAVIADIGAWRPKVKPGGLLTGDDYELVSVARAVDRLVPDRQLLEGGRVWWWRRP